MRAQTHAHAHTHMNIHSLPYTHTNAATLQCSLPCHPQRTEFSQDGTLLATAGNDQNIIVWNTSSWTKAIELKGHARSVFWGRWHPAGFEPGTEGTAKRFVSCDSGGQIMVWKMPPF
jgi:WD40 repeat protein